MGKSKGRNSGPQIGGAFTEADISAYQQELMGAPLAQARALPRAIELEQQLMPLLQSHYFSTMGSTAKGVQGLYSSLQPGTIEAQGSYGQSLLGMYGALGTTATQQAIAGLDPNARRNYELMQQQGADDLALGTQLNQQETDIAQGAARAAATARGLNFSRQGSDLEILNTYNMGQQRQAQRRQYAGAALQTAQGMQQYGAQAYLSPALQTSNIYSIPGLLGGAEGAIGAFGPQTLQMESQYMANIRANRMQMQMAQEQANATRSAGMISGLATLGAAAIKFCWVAREAYGKDNPKWLVFREWMLTSAPEWFFDLYMKHGEEFAEFISDKPLLKAMVRKTMDFLIRREEKKLTIQIYG